MHSYILYIVFPLKYRNIPHLSSNSNIILKCFSDFHKIFITKPHGMHLEKHYGKTDVPLTNIDCQSKMIEKRSYVVLFCSINININITVMVICLIKWFFNNYTAIFDSAIGSRYFITKKTLKLIFYYYSLLIGIFKWLQLIYTDRRWFKISK